MCVGDVVGDVMAMVWWFGGDVIATFRRCCYDVLEMLWSCYGDVLVASWGFVDVMLML